MRSRTKPEWQTRIAKERVEKLFSEAGKAKTQALANRYVALARKIGMRYNVRLPKGLKRKYCKYCYAFFRSGNYKHRTKNGFVNVTCLKCGKTSRYPLSKRSKKVKKC